LISLDLLKNKIMQYFRILAARAGENEAQEEQLLLYIMFEYTQLKIHLYWNQFYPPEATSLE
jgi:hypothetical protein